jgi:Met-zincin
MLLTATATRTGEPYNDLQEVYARMLGQWATELNHVAAIVGGFSTQQKHVGQQGVLFKPIVREKQAAAVKFLNDHAFQTPTWAINAEILRRIEPVGVLDRVRTGQQRVLNTLLSSARITRLVEQEALDGTAAYRPLDFLADVRKGIWNEIYNGSPVKVDAYRRNLQRAYIEMLADRINGRLAAVDDARAFFRGELKTLDADLRSSPGSDPAELAVENCRYDVASCWP